MQLGQETALGAASSACTIYTDMQMIAITITENNFFIFSSFPSVSILGEMFLHDLYELVQIYLI